MNAGSRFHPLKRSTRSEWRISLNVVRFWTKYEIKEVRQARQILGYLLFLRRVAIADHCDSSFSFDEMGVVRHGIPCGDEQLAEFRDDGFPKYVNCYSTEDKAMNAAALHSFLKSQPVTSTTEDSHDDVFAA